jgi:hypothetical protein
MFVAPIGPKNELVSATYAWARGSPFQARVETNAKWRSARVVLVGEELAGRRGARRSVAVVAPAGDEAVALVAVRRIDRVGDAATMSCWRKSVFSAMSSSRERTTSRSNPSTTEASRAAVRMASSTAPPFGARGHAPVERRLETRPESATIARSVQVLCAPDS